MRVRESAPVYLSLFVVPVICEPLICQPISVCVSEYPHLSSLDLADKADNSSTLEIDLLVHVGSDLYWELVTGGVSRGSQGPVALHTKLGWVLSGPAISDGAIQSSTNLISTHVLTIGGRSLSNDDLDKQLQSFWDLESLGIVEPVKTLYDDFVNTVTINNGRYEVALPWKEHHKTLPSNYNLSLKRLKGLLHRLKQSPAIFQQYDSIIRDQIEQGIVEPAVDSGNLCHYLPHHAVVRNDKMTTKLRIVYDASARERDGASLNDCIHRGSKFNQFIFDILLRFRELKYPLMADLEKAFLQVSMTSADRDVLRFLWVDDISKNAPNICVLRFTRVEFGVSASLFLLNATLCHHLKKYSSSHPRTTHTLLQSLYVDDMIAGANTEEEAFELYVQSKKIFRDAEFNLRKFVTSSTSLQKRIDCAEQTHATQLQGTNESGYLDETYVQVVLGDSAALPSEEQKVLGVRWQPTDDCLVFDVSTILQLGSTLEPTKRNVISVIGRFYDPLGFLAPVIVQFKIFFQKLCSNKIDWDQALSEELAQEWNSLVGSLSGSTPLSLSRYYLSNCKETVISRHICGFCDASMQAYAAVVYIAQVTENETVISFVAAKTRVAPLNSQTIPRLELLSALLLSRLTKKVLHSLQSMIPQLELHCYTDSLVALYWIQGVDKEWKPFIQNRVTEIRRAISPSCWSHCPGNSNPADLPSRGLSLQELSKSILWRRGPDWLPSAVSSQVGGTQPAEKLSYSVPEECLLELKNNGQTMHSLIATETQQSLDNVLCIKEYSNLCRLIKVLAYVLRAIKLFKGVSLQLRDKSLTLIPAELASAEKLLITHTQSTLVVDRNFPSLKKQLDLFVDGHGLWRCGGRLTNADIPYSTKHPVLLPRDHHFTVLIVRDAHERVAHDGVRETLTEIRQKFWIVKGRSLVKSIIHRCVLCRRFEGAPFRGPPPPPLPDFRVKKKPPFSYTGVDFAGPFHVRSFGLINSDKVWICLFTCLVVRAVHLEIVTDLSTETFIRCLKRFAARRGIPLMFLSDNGKTFKAAARFIKAVFKEDI